MQGLSYKSYKTSRNFSERVFLMLKARIDVYILQTPNCWRNSVAFPSPLALVLLPSHRFAFSPCCYYWLQYIKKYDRGVLSDDITFMSSVTRIDRMIQQSKLRKACSEILWHRDVYNSFTFQKWSGLQIVPTKLLFFKCCLYSPFLPCIIFLLMVRLLLLCQFSVPDIGVFQIKMLRSVYDWAGQEYLLISFLLLQDSWRFSTISYPSWTRDLISTSASVLREWSAPSIFESCQI
jgi:hypothetical protein